MVRFLTAALAFVSLCGAAQPDEAMSVKLFEDLGGKIKHDDKQSGRPVVEVELQGAEARPLKFWMCRNLSGRPALWRRV